MVQPFSISSFSIKLSKFVDYAQNDNNHSPLYRSEVRENRENRYFALAVSFFYRKMVETLGNYKSSYALSLHKRFFLVIASSLLCGFFNIAYFGYYISDNLLINAYIISSDFYNFYNRFACIFPIQFDHKIWFFSSFVSCSEIVIFITKITDFFLKIQLQSCKQSSLEFFLRFL